MSRGGGARWGWVDEVVDGWVDEVVKRGGLEVM